MSQQKLAKTRLWYACKRELIGFVERRNVCIMSQQKHAKARFFLVPFQEGNDWFCEPAKCVRYVCALACLEWSCRTRFSAVFLLLWMVCGLMICERSGWEKDCSFCLFLL